VTTHIFDRDDEYLASDAVFAVKDRWARVSILRAAPAGGAGAQAG
jgi:hypothetical protein